MALSGLDGREPAQRQPDTPAITVRLLAPSPSESMYRRVEPQIVPPPVPPVPAGRPPVPPSAPRVAVPKPGSVQDSPALQAGGNNERPPQSSGPATTLPPTQDQPPPHPVDIRPPANPPPPSHVRAEPKHGAESPAPVANARFDAAYLQNPSPAYPRMSRRAGEEGTVILRVFVLADGRPSGIEIAESSGHPRLDDAARETVRSWRFVPARQGDTAVDSWLRVPIAFRLQDENRP